MHLSVRKSDMKKLFEKIVQGLLTCSGFVTSIVILLIIGFLFTEGAGLFRGHVIEEGYVLALNRENPVSRLTAAQIKGVFDEDIVNWKEVGGPDLAIETFRLEDVDRYFSGEELGPQYERAGEAIAGLDICYHRELKTGETFQLRRRSLERGALVDGVKDGLCHFESQVFF